MVNNALILWHSMLRNYKKGKNFQLMQLSQEILLGVLIPMPGLFSKYFDKNQDTIVEVIQDTCGRHDTFGTACTLKYYEDYGVFWPPELFR